MDVVEVIAGAVLATLLLVAGIANVSGKANSLRLLTIVGVLLLALLAIRRGDPALLTAVGDLVKP